MRLSHTGRLKLLVVLGLSAVVCNVVLIAVNTVLIALNTNGPKT